VASGHNGDIERAAYGYEQTRAAAMAVFAKRPAKGMRPLGQGCPQMGLGRASSSDVRSGPCD
jgi:hypothetical protein